MKRWQGNNEKVPTRVQLTTYPAKEFQRLRTEKGQNVKGVCMFFWEKGQKRTQNNVREQG